MAELGARRKLKKQSVPVRISKIVRTYIHTWHIHIYMRAYMHANTNTHVQYIYEEGQEGWLTRQVAIATVGGTMVERMVLMIESPILNEGETVQQTILWLFPDIHHFRAHLGSKGTRNGSHGNLTLDNCSVLQNLDKSIQIPFR
ncbi:hypothetical protein LOAG_00409 [Loa loa]|uniref:Uncharacterized protein n=2 Tax=Loa loa TaxID=7209 RepID=A0A1S0UC24_LOALO|nr:hypothetical protein LOAG_00409 [Loa loa]EFO28074.1 hypothetical protein LOAG_00409 [Loa loa]